MIELNSILAPTAQDRAVGKLFTELCGNCFSYVPILRVQTPDDRAAAVQSFREGLVGVNAFLKYYGGDPFLLGDVFTLAECNVAPFVYRACIILPAFTGRDKNADNDVVVDPLKICEQLDLTHLKRWMQAVLTRPSVVATSVDKDQMIARTSKLMERFTAMSK